MLNFKNFQTTNDTSLLRFAVQNYRFVGKLSWMDQQLLGIQLLSSLTKGWEILFFTNENHYIICTIWELW